MSSVDFHIDNQKQTNKQKPKPLTLRWYYTPNQKISMYCALSQNYQLLFEN